MLKSLTYIALAISLLGSYSCSNKCKDLDCQNDAFCSDGECFCQPWYSGDDCALLYNRNYEGEYKGQFEESGLRGTSTLSFTADPEVPNRIWLEGEVYFDFLNDSLLVIPTQTVIAEPVSQRYEGRGSYDLNHISFEYTMTFLDENRTEVSLSFSGTRLLESEIEE